MEPLELILDTKDLPTIPAVVADTLRVANDPSASIEELEWIVVRDLSLTARVLRVANSAVYGFPRRIESVHEAIVMLGTRKVKHVTAAMAASELFKGGNQDLVQPQQLWLHALATSLWARHLIEWKQFWGCGSAVTASLLHDLGILALVQQVPDRYQPVLGKARADGGRLLETEQRELGTTHAYIGGALCAKWQLPVSVTQLVSHHHSPTAPADPALAVVMLANRLAHMSDVGPFLWKCKPEAPECLMGINLDSGPGLEFFQKVRQPILEQVQAFKDAALR
jgi:HD-like signal output (HDOD) protein